MSTFKEAIQSGLEEYLQALTRAIEGLTPTEIRWQATPPTNHTDFSVVLFRSDFVLASERYPMKAYKNQ
jgi:hypothetical protein